MTDKSPPRRPSDEREEPYYIDGKCGKCDTELVLWDEFTDKDKVLWYDEWVCPQCDDGVHLDVPKEYMEELSHRIKEYREEQ